MQSIVLPDISVRRRVVLGSRSSFQLENENGANVGCPREGGGLREPMLGVIPVRKTMGIENTMTAKAKTNRVCFT